MSAPVSRRKLLGGAGAASLGLLFKQRFALAQPADGQPGGVPPAGPVGMQIKITAVTTGTLRLSIAAVAEDLDTYYDDGSLAPRAPAPPLFRQRTNAGARVIPFGDHSLHLEPDPLRVRVMHPKRGQVQQLTFRPELNQVQFEYGDGPVYGLGPGTHPLDRRGTKDAMRNGAGDNLRIFGARNPIPWLMSRHWGLFIHEPGGSFDLTGDVGVFHPSDVARGQDLFLAVAETPADLLREYAEITGFPHLPARWTFGFQQSHRTLDSPEQILGEAKTFREKQLPCDAMIYLGTGFCPSGWNTGHGSFVFNEGVFPDPQAMLHQFHGLHFKVILHVVNPPENLHGEVTDSGAASALPGDAANYWEQHVPFVRMGVDGWWPDEGDVLPTASRLVRNRMYWEGGRMSQPDRRPFALHRNCYAGIQRWGWLWSGDTFSTWKTLETQIMEGINAGLNGVPFWGTDIGGFVPTAEFTAELFVRWFQFGAFCPSFRCHGRTWQLRRPWGWNTGSYGPSEMGSDAVAILPKEADLHNAAVEPICRKFLETRYRLLPYLYSCAWETHRAGMPLIRSLGLAFPDSAQAWQTVDAFLLGPALLAAPVYEPGAHERKLTLPGGVWRNYWTGDQVQGGGTVTLAAPLDSMPLLVRAGSIVPTGPVKQYADEPSDTPVLFTVYPGADGSFTHYDDDGLSFAYEDGHFATLECTWHDASHTLTLHQGQGADPLPRHVQVRLSGAPVREVQLGAKTSTIRL